MSKSPNSEQLTRFLVLFEGRSGSTFFVESLDSHPDILSGKEPFSTLRKHIRRGEERPESQLDFLDQYFFNETNKQYRAVGFKTKLKDIVQTEAVAKWLRDNQLKIILLQRRNRVKLVVSLMNAVRLNEQTGDWNRYRKDVQLGPLEIDLETFGQWLTRLDGVLQTLVEYAESLGLPLMNICYEELLTSADATFNKTCDFLNVSYQPLDAKCIKNTSDKLSEVIANFDELKAHYAGTRYESMFDERLVSPAS